jgi:hypothetical protein
LGLFRYHSNIELKQGLSANGKCASDYSLQKAENTVGGRFRRGVASFIGFGGLESLGMAVGCGTCSTIWSALNTALPGSGLFAIAGPPAGDLVVGIGFASVCAMGWAASSLTEGAARIGMVLSSKGQTGSGGEDPPDGQRAPLLLAAQGAQRYPAAA